MDDARIKELTEEVLGALYRRGPGEPAPNLRPAASALEARVAALEARLQQVQPGGVTAIAVAGPNARATTVVTQQTATHPALQLLSVQGCTDGRCVLDPDLPCTKSNACRTFGH